MISTYYNFYFFIFDNNSLPVASRLKATRITFVAFKILYKKGFNSFSRMIVCLRDKSQKGANIVQL